MAKAGQRKCMSCKGSFLPDHRKGERQRYRCAADCRRASKAASQVAWLARPPNNDHFSGPVHVARVQAWRAAHPGYSRNRARPSRALQDLLIAESPLLAGLVAHLFQPALQDDMASTTRRLVQLGRDVINGRCGEGSSFAQRRVCLTCCHAPQVASLRGEAASPIRPTAPVMTT
jgi:hypothetical protein